MDGRRTFLTIVFGVIIPIVLVLFAAFTLW